MRICEQCGKEHDGTFGSGRFCCRSCSNKWVAIHQSDAAKKRKVEKLKIWSESNPEIVHKIRSENGRKSAGALRKPMKVREDGYKLSPRARKNMSLAKKVKLYPN